MKSLLYLLRYWVAPSSTWRMVTSGQIVTARHEREWFYPLMALMALSAFVQMVWDASLVQCLVTAIAEFVGLFIAYLVCPSAMLFVIEKLKIQKKVYESHLKLFSMFNLTLGIVVAIVQNVLPSSFSPMYMLLIYMLFLISATAKLILGEESDDKRLIFVFAAFLLFLLVPILIIYLLINFIPSEE